MPAREGKTGQSGCSDYKLASKWLLAFSRVTPVVNSSSNSIFRLPKKFLIIEGAVLGTLNRWPTRLPPGVTKH